MGHANRAEIEIARPPEDVFPWLVEPEKRMRWVEGLESAEHLGGDRYRDTLSAGGMRTEVDVEVRRLEPPTLVEIAMSAKQFTATARQEAQAAGAGTRVISALEAEYKGFMAKAAAPMITRQAQATLERSLAKLKELVEADAS